MLVNFANLDFDQIKQSITEYLRSNSNFSDYDFEGSNLSTIIDALAYNTYITSYNANMVSNEVFIDSATLRENVVSLARNIGYVPRSRRAARANISFFVDTSSYDTQPQTITLNKGLVANSATFGTTNYRFSLMNDITVPVVNEVASFDNVDVYEGTYVTTNFSYDNYNPQQRYILNAENIDTSTIEVIVKPSRLSSVKRQYRLAESLFDVTGDSPVFWVQEIEDSRYEIIFGDGVFGKKLEEPNFVEVSFLVTGGSGGNGVTDLTFSGKLTTSRDNVAINSGISLITTNTASYSGDDIETVESIKKYAPQIYSSQRRAVTSTDYENLLPTIYREAESVSVFGGEELSPPQFGKVFASIKPVNGAYLSNLVKDNIKREIKKYSVGGVELEITDLKYLYVEVLSNVYYDGNKISSGEEVKTLVSNNIDRYANSTELNRFGARFKYSKFLSVIDNTNDAITSNITTIQMRRDLRASLNAFAEYEICFGNRFHVKNHGHSPASGVGYNIKSSGFQVSGTAGVVYLADTPNMGLEDGTINLIRLNSPTDASIVRRNVGTIDYIKGEIKLNPINIISTQLNKQFPVIEVSAIPFSNDIIGLQDLYIQLDTNNVTINSINDRISSGYDISGSNYVVSSSFANGALVRGSTDAVSIGRVTQQQTSGTTTTTTTGTSSYTTTSTPSTTTSTSTPTYSY